MKEGGRKSKNAGFSAVAISMNDKTKLQSSEKTVANELALINNHLIPYFKDKDINRIDYGEMLKFFKAVDEMVSVKKHTLGEPWKTATKKAIKPSTAAYISRSVSPPFLLEISCF